MFISEIDLYTALRLKLGETEAKQLVEFVKGEVKDSLDTRAAQFASKEDIGRLETKIAESKSEIIKWMFILWIGSVGVLSGIMFAMLHAYLK